MKFKSILIVALIFFSCKSEKKKLAEEIIRGEAMLFGDTVKSLNMETANVVFTDYLKYSENYPDDTTSASYLFKAADLANGLRRPKEAIEILERLRTNYPEFKKSAAALFMQAFIYETSMQDKEKAKEKYKEFIEKYPDHALFASAKASLDQLNANLSDEDLIKLFEQKNK